MKEKAGRTRLYLLASPTAGTGFSFPGVRCCVLCEFSHAAAPPAACPARAPVAPVPSPTTGRVGKYWVAFPYGLPDCAAMDLLQITPAQLRQAANLQERIDELERELESTLGTSATATPSRKLHWTQTPAGRAKLARAIRRSWRTGRRSLKRTAPSSARTGKKRHWTQTPAGRAKMARFMQRRWQVRRTAAARR